MGPSKHARQDRREAQGERVGVEGAGDQPDGLAATRHEGQARPARADALVRFDGEGEVEGLAWSAKSRSNSRRLAGGRDDEARCIPLRRRLTRGVPLVLREPETRREEALGLSVPPGDVDAGVRPLREDEERSFAARRRRVASRRCLRRRRRPWPERSPGERATLPAPMLCLADAHCHLDAGYFQEGPDAVLERARAAGVVGFVVVGLAAEVEGPGSDGLEPVRFAVDLARRSPDGVTACVGLHPHDASRWTSELHEGLRALAALPEVAAVGEIGLDYHYDRSPREAQREAFARLVGLARELRKPIVVHTRSAPEETLSILEREGARDVGGIIHCFSEDRPFAERALALGFDLSFSGIVTFKGARSVREVAAWAPPRSNPRRDRQPVPRARADAGQAMRTGARGPHGALRRGASRHPGGGRRSGDPRQYRASLRSRLRASVLVRP